jgi:hypothetical protein
MFDKINKTLCKIIYQVSNNDMISDFQDRKKKNTQQKSSCTQTN